MLINSGYVVSTMCRRFLVVGVIIPLFLGLTPSSGLAGGGKDPSLDKPTSKLTCEELEQSIRAAENDTKRLNEVIESAANARNGVDFLLRSSETSVSSLKADLAAETDKAEKAALRKRLKGAKRDLRRNKSTFRQADFDLKNARQAMDQNIERRTRFEEQKRELGC